MSARLLARKHDRFFDILDLDGDGSVGEGDIEAIARHISADFGSPLTPGGFDIHEEYRTIWRSLRDRADLAGNNQISRDEWHIAFRGRDRDEMFRDVFWLSCDIEFDIADTDQDGLLRPEEFVQLMGPWGVERELALTLFARLGNDPFAMSRKEYSQAWHQFLFSSSRRNLANHMMGPLG